MIEKKMFFFWSGDKMSFLRYMTLYSFCKLNPDWEVTLYVSKRFDRTKTWYSINQQDYLQYAGEDYFNRIPSKVKIVDWQLINPNNNQLMNLTPVHLCDYCEWEHLYKDGGFYADMDILFVKPLDNLYNFINENNYDTVVSHRGFFSIGFLACNKDNRFFKDIYDKSFISYRGDYQSIGVELWYGHLGGGCGTEHYDTMVNWYNDLKIYNFPFNIIYPWDYTMLPEIFEKVNRVPEESYSIHWYAGDPYSQKYNSMINEHTFRSMNSTICNYMKELL